MSKECYRCQKVKPINQFNRDKSRKDGYALYCRKCAIAYHRQYNSQTTGMYEDFKAGEHVYIKARVLDIKRQRHGYVPLKIGKGGQYVTVHCNFIVKQESDSSD